MVTGKPLPVVEWQFKGMPVKTLNMSNGEDLGNGSLVFRPVMATHAGPYSCVIDGPSFKFISTTLNVRSGNLIGAYLHAVCVVLSHH